MTTRPNVPAVVKKSHKGLIIVLSIGAAASLVAALYFIFKKKPVTTLIKPVMAGTSGYSQYILLSDWNKLTPAQHAQVTQYGFVPTTVAPTGLKVTIDPSNAAVATGFKLSPDGLTMIPNGKTYSRNAVITTTSSKMIGTSQFYYIPADNTYVDSRDTDN